MQAMEINPYESRLRMLQQIDGVQMQREAAPDGETAGCPGCPYFWTCPVPHRGEEVREPEEIDRLKASGRFDSIIVEADGSKGLPLKSYGEYEPPIPQSSDLVILVIGVDGFYQPIEEVVHRPEIYAAMTRSRLRSPVTAKNYLRHFRNANGALKNVPDCPVLVMLNRIDLLKDREVLAELIPGLLSNERVEAVLLTDLSDYRLETVFRNEV